MINMYFNRMNISTRCPLFEMFLVKLWYCAGSDGRCSKYRTTDLSQLVQLNWNLRTSFWGPEETRIHVTCWNVSSLWNTVPKILSSSWLSLGNKTVWTGRKDLSTAAVRCCETCLFLVCGRSNVERLGFFTGGLFSYAQHMQVWLRVALRSCWAKIFVVHEMLQTYIS